MDGFCAKRTANHLIEPIGYTLLRKTVRRKAPVHSAAEQFRIHSVASTFESSMFHITPPHSLDKAYTYTMTEIDDCIALTAEQSSMLITSVPEIKEELTRFKVHMITEGYFPRGFTLLYYQRGPYRFELIDFSLFGLAQGTLVRFPDFKWSYDFVQAELLFNM